MKQIEGPRISVSSIKLICLNLSLFPGHRSKLWVFDLYQCCNWCPFQIDRVIYQFVMGVFRNSLYEVRLYLFFISRFIASHVSDFKGPSACLATPFYSLGVNNMHHLCEVRS